MSLFFSRLTISPEIKIQSLTGVFQACLLDHFSLLLPLIIPCHSFCSTWTSSRPNVLSFQGFYVCSSLWLRTSLPRHLCGFLPPFWPLLKSLTFLVKTAFLVLPSLILYPPSLFYFYFSSVFWICLLSISLLECKLLERERLCFVHCCTPSA